MRIAVHVLLAAAALSVGDSPRFVVPNSPDVTIRTRGISRGRVFYSNTVRLKGARERTERTMASTAVPPDAVTYITQCDRRRMLILNHAARVYGSFPIDAEVTRRGDPGAAHTVAADEPVERVITIDSVDTGERRDAPTAYRAPCHHDDD